MSWRPKTLKDISTKITKGTTPKHFTDNGVTFIKAGSLNGDSSLNEQGFTWISEETHHGSLTRSVLREGDILLTIAGANIGKCGLVLERHLPANTNQAVGIIRIDHDAAVSRFVYYFFKQNKMFLYIQGLNAQAAQPNINLSMLGNIVVPMPRYDVQQKIATILSDYDNLIENNLRRIKLLEESARLLYREWFVNLRFPGHEHARIVDGVPEGWESKPLNEICFQHKESIKPDKISPETEYIGLAHIPRRSITLNEWGKAKEVNSSKFTFKKRDILFGKIRPYFHKVGFTLCNGVTSSDAIVIRPYNPDYYHFLLIYVSSDAFVLFASKTVKEGSKMPRADWNYLIQQPVLLPKHSLLSIFSTHIETIQQQLELLASQNQKLKSARDLLLPRLMNGELTV